MPHGLHELAGAHVVITGASRGIGEGVADAMAAAGARVTLVGRNADTLAPVATRTGGAVLVADLSVPDEVDTLIRRAREQQGPVAVLVNNAAVNLPGPIATYDPARMRALYESNLVAPMVLARAALPDMLAARRGAVVNVSSLAGDLALRNVLPYGSSKAALSLATRGLRRELRGTGVTAQLVVLAVVDTAMIDDTNADHVAGTSAARFARVRPLAAADVGEAIVGLVRGGREVLVLPRVAAPAHALRFVPTRLADLLLTGIPKSL